MADLFARTFRFRVSLSPSPASDGTPPGGGPLGDGGFQECSGLDVEMDVAEYTEGGRNNGVIQRAGRAKVARIVLKRGMLHPADDDVNTELWSWFQDVVDGVRPLRRYDGTIEVLDDQGTAVATWTFSRGLPAKLVGPQLNARTGEVAIEELQIAHEGLRMGGI
jgi:phage tail-like protein